MKQNYISKINNSQVDDAQDIDIVMPMYNLIQYGNTYSKTSGSLWQYYRDEPDLEINRNIIDFPANNNNNNNNNSFSFNFIQKITGEIGNGGTKDVEKMVPLKYLCNIWRTIEMALINCEVNLYLKWSKACILVAGTAENQEPKFEITDAELDVYSRKVINSR